MEYSEFTKTTNGYIWLYAVNELIDKNELNNSLFSAIRCTLTLYSYAVLSIMALTKMTEISLNSLIEEKS